MNTNSAVFSAGTKDTLGENQQELHTPRVSVIVPVYNVAPYLPMCLDSLLFQSMSDIEIIMVNDGSPDNSQEIIDEYAARFPGRIVSLIKENGGLSSARKYGFEHARAPYVLFLDSDDYIEYHACEKLWTKAVEDHADVVYCSAYAFDETHHQYRYFGHLKKETPEDLFIFGKASIWGLLLRTEYIQEHPIFEDMVYEDAATSMAMLSHTLKISFVNAPLFAYVVNREGSLTFQAKHETVVHTILADELVWQRCNPTKRPLLAARLINRIVNESKKNYVIYDHMVAHAKDFACKLLPHDKELTKYCGGNVKAYKQLLLEPDEMFAPIVYLNGFDANADRNEYLDRVTMPFIGEHRIIWLDESNCDLSFVPDRVKEHHAAGHTDIVAAWFAAKKINETGGVYVGTDIRIINTFNRMRFYKSFWGFATNHTFNDRVFGGLNNQPVWDIFTSILERPNVSTVHQAISMTLCGWGGVHLSGKQQCVRESVMVLRSNVLTVQCDRYINKNICIWLPRFEKPEEYQAFFKQGYEECYAHLVEPTSTKTADVDRLIKERDAARKELVAMQKTLSWKITKPLRAIRTLMGKIKNILQN